MLRIKVFADHLHKITLNINRGSFMALGNAECLQTLAKQTNVKVNMLQCCSDIIKLWVTKIKGELIKQRSVAK